MKILKCIICLLMISIIFLNVAPVFAENSYSTYTYSNKAEYQHSPNAFYPVKTITRFGEAGGLSSAQDIKVDKKTNNVYIADTNADRILILDKDFNLLNEISEFKDKKGETHSLSSPNGICLNNGNLYVCDSNNARIVIFDEKCQFIEFINRPTSSALSDDFDFKPMKIAIDMVGRYNIVCENNLNGIVVLNDKKQFQGFTGAIKVQVSAVDLFWRRIMTQAQLENSQTLVPTPFNNVAADSEGFIYATTSSYSKWTIYDIIHSKDKTNTYSPVKRFSPSGADILKRNATFQPVGDLNFGTEQYTTNSDSSKLDAVAITKNDTYTLMDSEYCKLFTYDSDGYLLYAFGGKGDSLGNFQRLSGISYFGNDDESLLALDPVSDSITLFTKTDYGLLLDKAIDASYNNKASEAISLWTKVKEQNNNFDLAYLEIGKALLNDKKYDESMKYLKYAGDKENYSLAFKELRTERLQYFAIFIPIILILILLLVSKIFSTANKYNRISIKSTEKKTLKQQLIYAFHVVFHPFDGFWDLKNEKRGSPASATIILALLTGSFMISELITGYLFRDIGSSINLLLVFISVFGPVILWTLANWCLTSLMDGKGKLMEVYTATCYAAVPLIFTTVPIAIMSNFIMLDESIIMTAISGISVFWVIVLLFGSVISTHTYTSGRAFLVIILTIVVIVFMLFLGLLFFSVCQKLVSFIGDIYTEIVFRM